MPARPLRPCPAPGCTRLVTRGRCEEHQKADRIAQDAARGTAHSRGYTYRWALYSKAYLIAHPLCQCPECDEGRLRLRPSQVTDHRVPHRGDMKLFWDPANHQAMAKVCHDKKTATEDGGWGRNRNE
jgi:5-methylcytosine-specific restriction protein A